MDIIRNYLLSHITSLGIGGPADYFCKPKNPADIQAALQFAEKKQLPVTIIGYGSNLLVMDKGIRGLVIQIADNLACASVSGCLITASAGCLFSSVSKLAAYHGLTGLEFAVGIPGSLGGAIYMNAGAYGGEVGPLLEQVSWVSSQETGSWDQQAFTYSYRQSRAQDEQAIITSAKIRLVSGNRDDIYRKMKELQARRQARQPIDQPTAGSTFKRPRGHYVGPMIEETGLKGYQIGGAQVSTKHAGFIVNTGAATAADVISLITFIQKTIKTKYGVDLEPEIRIIGES